MGSQIPVTVIGGFLGAGKTTLLNRVLSEPNGVRYGVLVNDFGSISIDDRLVKAHDGETIAFANGCVCCSLGDNLLGTIDELNNSEHAPEQYLVEASGVANPRAIADMATLHPGLKRDMTVVLVDAETILDRAGDERLCDTVMMQLEHADLVVMNKCDVAADLPAVSAWLEEQVKCPIVQTQQANLPLALLDASKHSPDTTTYRLASSKVHNPGEVFDSAFIELPASTTNEKLQKVFRSAGVLRAKGFVMLDGNGLAHVEVVGERVAVAESVDSDADADGVLNQPTLGLVVISQKGAVDYDVLASWLSE